MSTETLYLTKPRELPLEPDVWNKEKQCEGRLKLVTKLIDRFEQRKFFQIDNCLTSIRDLDLDLLNRDLGWTSNAILVCEMEIYRSGDLLPKICIPQKEDSIMLICRIFRDQAAFKTAPDRHADAGDFSLTVEGTGSLTSFEVWRFPPEPIGPELTTLIGPDDQYQLELLDAETQLADKRQQAADNAELILLMIEKNTRHLDKSGPSKG